MTVINAFHPDFMKTHYPNFTKEFWSVEANQIERSKQPKAKRARAKAADRKSLERKMFLVFSKAGAPKQNAEKK